MLNAKRDLEAPKRFFRKMLEDQPLLAPDRIGTDAAGPSMAEPDKGRPCFAGPMLAGSAHEPNSLLDDGQRSLKMHVESYRP